MINVKIIDPATGNTARVNKRGILAVGPLAFSEFYTQSLSVINTAYNVIPPKTNMKFVITDLIITANRDVSATNGAIVDIYEGSSATSTVVVKQLYQDEITKLDRVVMVGLNIVTNVGVWLNAKTDDNTVRVNLGGYYVVNGQEG